MSKPKKQATNLKQINEIIQTVSGGQESSKQNNMAKAWDDVWTPEFVFMSPLTSRRSGRHRSSKIVAPSRKMVPLPALQKLLKTFLFTMKLCGLFHMSDDDQLMKDGRYTGKKAIILAAEKGMSLVVLVFCWGIVAFNLYYFPYNDFGFEGKAFTCIVYLAFFLQNAISATTYFVASSHRKMFKKLFRKWSAILIPEDVAEDIARHCHRAQWIVICVGFTVATFIIAVFIQIFFLRQDVEIFLDDDVKSNRSETYAYGVLAIISAFVWAFSLGFFVLICIVLRRLFYATHKALCRDIAANSGPIQLEVYRTRHERINSLLEIVDKIYGEMIFFYFFNYMLLLCFISYELLWIKSAKDTFLIRGVWCFISVGTIVVICFAASSINEVAHKSFKYLHRMDLTQVSEGKHVQLLAYMLRLNGAPLGLSAWGLFTVTREVILTMASVFMTYLLILAQLKPSFHVNKDIIKIENANTMHKM